jgi:hypothetical protein
MLSNTVLKLIAKSVTVSLGILAVNVTSSLANPLQETLVSLSKDIKQVSLRQVPDREKNFFESGIYLYGESSQPEQIGHEYMVFEVNGNNIVGAFYQPASEFACFSGTVDHQGMNLNVVDPYENEIYAYTIPLKRSETVASTSNSLSPSVSLDGYKLVNHISDNDRRILDICIQQ